MNSALSSPSSKIQKLVKGQGKGGDKDIISKLHDNILHYILSFLPTKDVVQTSILSIKWRYLWTGMSNFDFNDSCNWQMNNETSELGTCLLKLVDRVLLHDVAQIQKLRLLFFMPVSSFRAYMLWVYYAVKRNVQELDLSLTCKSNLFVALQPFYF